MATKKSAEISHQKISTVPEDVNINDLIPVRNGFHGTLVYHDSRTNEDFIWSEFGDTQEMELKQLQNAKNTNRFFFENNYFLFDDEYSWVIEYLRVGKYYEHAISIEGYSELFSKSPKEIKTIVGDLTSGQRESLIMCAQEKIRSGEIDSIKIVRALEDGLGVTLIEEK